MSGASESRVLRCGGDDAVISNTEACVDKMIEFK